METLELFFVEPKDHSHGMHWYEYYIAHAGIDVRFLFGITGSGGSMDLSSVDNQLPACQRVGTRHILSTNLVHNDLAGISLQLCSSAIELPRECVVTTMSSPFPIGALLERESGEYLVVVIPEDGV